jgi:polysaccharide biosynthesis PFTS motif protein
MEAFYLGERLTLNQVNEIPIIAGLSAQDIRLGSIQKSMLRTLQKNNFKKAITYSKLTNTLVWFPISRQSQKRLSGLNIAFNPAMCSFLNVIFRCLFIVKAFKKAFTNYIFLFQNFTRLKNPNNLLEERVYLGGFSVSNFPSPNFATYDFLQWIQHKLVTEKLFLHDCSNLHYKGNSTSMSQVRYNPIVTTIGSFWSEFVVLVSLSFLIMKSLLWSRVSFFDLLSQIDELFIAVRIRSNAFRTGIELALFPNTVIVARPLWTISLEQIGTEVVLVNYSASAEPLEIGSKRVVDGVWNLSSWTRTWIVDAYQEHQMRSISQFYAKDFRVVGVPYWSGRKLEPTFFTGGPWVSVFDTTIRTNLVFSASSIDDLGWDNPHLEEEFIRLVLGAAAPLGLKVLHKKKRRVTESSQRDFEEITRILKDEFGVFYTVVDEDVAPESLIENSSFVISKPISTIAFAAAHDGVPTIFLDPTGNVCKNDPGLRGLPLAQKSSDLSSFFLTI